MAGIAAYIIGLDAYRNSKRWTENSPSPLQKVNELFGDLTDGRTFAYPRRKNDNNYPNAIWNGVTRAQWSSTCQRSPTNSKVRRDDSQPKACEEPEKPDDEPERKPKSDVSYWSFVDLGSKEGGTSYHVFSGGFGGNQNLDPCTAKALVDTPKDDPAIAKQDPQDPSKQTLNIGPFDVDPSTPAGKSCKWEFSTSNISEGTLSGGKMVCSENTWSCQQDSKLDDLSKLIKCGKDESGWLRLASCTYYGLE